ncbi:MAG: hypothetical protein ABIJ61_09700 [bacterium]
MPKTDPIKEALAAFAAAVSSKLNQVVTGEPEDQLRGPFENLLGDIGRELGSKVVCTGETRLSDRLGKPDYGISADGLLAGYVELKAPGSGADTKRFKGRNREQWKRFQVIPNLLYCDGNEWALYQDGKQVGRTVRLAGDVVRDGRKAVTADDAQAVARILSLFLSWKPVLPFDRKGKIDLNGFAQLLAPLCRMLRDDVTDALKDPDSPLVQLAKDWRQLLFPDAPDAQFADAYAQTVTFALLLGRSEGAQPLTIESAEKSLAAQHNLLSRAAGADRSRHPRVDVGSA